MLAILNSLNAHNLPIFQLILMILVSKFMVHGTLSDKIYFSLGLITGWERKVHATHSVDLYSGQILV